MIWISLVIKCVSFQDYYPVIYTTLIKYDVWITENHAYNAVNKLSKQVNRT